MRRTHHFQLDDAWVRHYREISQPETFAKVYGMVENIDCNVGRVFAKLDALNLTDDTIVIYTWDHGPCLSACDPKHGDRWNGEFRSRKGTPYEGACAC